MTQTEYRGRRAFQIENTELRVTVLAEGGHIAEILHKETGINPLWTPNWPSIEPSTYDPQKHTAYGTSGESKLLAGIMGHNLCIDLFGGPSEEEAAAGLTPHGESSIVPYSIRAEGEAMVCTADLPLATLRVERRLSLKGSEVLISESVENRSGTDRPIAWTQHATIGPPFLKHGVTRISAPATKCRTYESEFGDVYLPATDFDWPNAPTRAGGTVDLRIYTKAEQSSGYTAQLIDPHREDGYVMAWSPESRLLFGYRWKRTDFPWLGLWIENRSRTHAPWNGNSVTLGLEFGASPFPEIRRKMIERRSLFGVPGYRWIAARKSVQVNYSAFARKADSLPEA